MFNKKKKEKKIYNLIETQVDTFGKLTNMHTYNYQFETLEEALEELETFAKAFEMSCQGENFTCVRICDDPTVKMIVARDYKPVGLDIIIHETRIYIRESYI